VKAVGAKLIVLFVLGAVVLNFPVLAIFNRGATLLGLPVLYLYLFGIWVVGIIAVWALARMRWEDEE